jgi:hypothetical protein
MVTCQVLKTSSFVDEGFSRNPTTEKRGFVRSTIMRSWRRRTVETTETRIKIYFLLVGTGRRNGAHLLSIITQLLLCTILNRRLLLLLLFFLFEEEEEEEEFS